MIDNYLLQHQEKIALLCSQHQVKKLFAFGSIVDGRFVAGKSDVDLLIEFKDDVNKKQKATSLLLIWVTLQNFLKCKVDLVHQDNLKGKYFKKYLEMYKEEIYPNLTK